MLIHTYDRRSRGGNAFSPNRPITEEEIRRYAPAVFMDEKHSSRGHKYAHVTTASVLDALKGDGFVPYMVAQTRPRKDPSREGFTKHMLRLRHVSHDATQTGSVNEIVLINSHDGTTALQMMAGQFRIVCANGLLMGNVDVNVRTRHSGVNLIDSVREGAHHLVTEFDHMQDVKEAMISYQMTDDLIREFGNAALALRFPAVKGKATTAPISVEQITAARRREDESNDLWTVFNRVQENVIRGGIHGVNANGRKTTTRAINHIDHNVRTNRILWKLTNGILRNGVVGSVDLIEDAVMA